MALCGAVSSANRGGDAAEAAMSMPSRRPAERDDRSFGETKPAVNGCQGRVGTSGKKGEKKGEKKHREDK